MKRHAIWLLPILLMALIAPFISGWDLALARHYYEMGTPEKPFLHNFFVKFIYTYGPVPADITAGLSLLALIASYLCASCKKWRPYALYLILTLAIGGGIITHLVLKDHWGRPRPRQVIEFGGHKPFRPFYKPDFAHHKPPLKSFPCGHCTTGFYFFSFVILGRRLQKKWLIYSGLTLTIALSGLLGYARIAAGGHFLSDVLFCALVMWLTALFVDWIIFGK